MLGAADLAASLLIDLDAWWRDHHAKEESLTVVDATRSARLDLVGGHGTASHRLLDLVERPSGDRCIDGGASPSLALVEPGSSVRGLEHPDDWLLLDPEGTAAALERCRAGGCLVLVDADLDDEQRTGSVSIDERHLLSRLVCAAADVVIAVGAPPPFGQRDHDLLVHDLAQIARADAIVLRVAASVGRELAVGPVGVALLAALDRVPRRVPIRAPAPIPVRPGELGTEHWPEVPDLRGR